MKNPTERVHRTISLSPWVWHAVKTVPAETSIKMSDFRSPVHTIPPQHSGVDDKECDNWEYLIAQHIDDDLWYVYAGYDVANSEPRAKCQTLEAAKLFVELI